MEKLFQISGELQLSILCGYIAYKIAFSGKNVQHRTEEFLAIVFAFGFVASYLSKYLVELFDLDPNGILFLLIPIAFTIVFSSFWRKFLESAYLKTMKFLNIYHDDHAVSAFRSILNAKQKWTFINIHLKDGRKFCTNFSELPLKLPLSNITINEDGVALYITDIYFPDERHEKYDVKKSDTGYVIDYIPASIIERYEIGWI